MLKNWVLMLVMLAGLMLCPLCWGRVLGGRGSASGAAQVVAASILLFLVIEICRSQDHYSTTSLDIDLDLV